MMELSIMKKKCSKKIVVRQYKKSSIPRLRWTPQLHELFIEAVQHLGGGHKATPKRIQQMMAVKGLKISHVKSHLQMYRNLKEPANLNIVRSMNNFHEERPQFSFSCSSPLEHVCETLEYGPSKSSKQIDPLSDQSPNYKAIINAHIAENNIYCYDYQEAQGSLSSGMTKEEEEDGGPSSEICEFPHEADGECEREINFWPLDNYHKNSQCDTSAKQVVQSTKDNSHINLDLSISSCFYC
ncbi:two-component response regulator ORR29-like [Solanum dulcamara]|uniref:two-component response regulator ORR29-like n=1 Tax=Solanum dulcamara TaxID=45834 RepID=UPI0024867B29|nr:two-component response regulator ORR29-like [Solanum dulcamara]